jgi:PAS domain S-box-containing protein
VVVTADKRELWVRAIGIAEFIDGVCTRIYGSFQDINDRKEAEIRLQSLADNLPGVVFQYLIYPDGTDSLKYVTKGSQEVWGFAAEEVIQNNMLIWDSVIAGGEIDKVQKSIADSIAFKTQWNARWKYVMPGGEIRTHLGYGSPNFLADGTVLFNSVILDVTSESKKDELLEKVSMLAKIGSWEFDLDQNKHYWTDMMHTIFETDPKLYVPNNESSILFLQEDFRPILQSKMKECVEEGITVDFETLIVTANKNEKWIRVVCSAEMQDGKAKRLLGSTQDITERKKVEEKLIDSEQKYRQLALELQLQQVHLTNAQEVAKVGSWETDLSNFKVKWSDEMHRIFGTDRDNFVATHEQFLNCVHPLDRDKVDKAFADSAQAPVGSQSIVEHRIITPSGELKVLEERWKITYNDQEEPLLAIGICQDITERKKSEEDIRDSEEKRRLIMSGALDAIICIDTNGTVTFWNPQAEVIFGWKEAEVLKKDLAELIIPQSFRKYHNEGIEHYLKTGEGKVLNILLELSAIKRSGEEFPIELTVIPIKQGGEVFFCAFIRDITERKKAEVSLLQSNERFEKVTQATNDAIWDWDILKETYYRSRGIERFFGKEASGLFAKSDLWTRDHFHPDDLANIKDSFYKAMANPLTSRWEWEYRVINELGKTLYVIDRAVIIRNSEGKATRVVGAMTDISEQTSLTIQLSELNKTLQQHTLELERSNEELEQFAFVASHDLQEPLRMISSFMELLQRRYGNQLDTKAQQYIGFATEGAEKMKQIILDLLEYSRAGRPSAEKEKVDLNDLLSEFKVLRRKLISEKAASVIVRELPTINTYRAAVTQILHCLIDNALKYAKANMPPIVEIDATEKDTEWEFSIKDNGIGIDPQFFDKIFVIFQRLHNKDEYSGTGIGLSIAKRHVEFLGGRIWLTSTPGEGSIFYFTIPKTKKDE